MGHNHPTTAPRSVVLRTRKKMSSGVIKIRVFSIKFLLKRQYCSENMTSFPHEYSEGMIFLFWCLTNGSAGVKWIVYDEGPTAELQSPLICES